MSPASHSPVFSGAAQSTNDILSSSAASGTTLSATHTWQHVASAALTGLAVGTLAMTTLGFLVVVILGLGLSRIGAPHLVVWPIVAVAGLFGMVMSMRLGLRVWRIELASTPTSPVVTKPLG